MAASAATDIPTVITRSRGIPQRIGRVARAPSAPPRLAAIAAAVAALATAGCSIVGGNEPPPQPRIEPISTEMPTFTGPYAVQAERLPAPPPRIVARLRLNGGNDDQYLYMSDLFLSGCWAEFTATEASSGNATYLDPWMCIPGDRATNLFQTGPERGAPTRATAGTVDSSLDELRITFKTRQEDCGSRTYALDGPTMPSAPSRRVFLLDMGNCEWGKVEALRDGQVVDTYEQHPYRD